ncbi:MAG: hypothetical protein DWB57_13675 [Candidatus Brocadia sp.]|nr:hypothetical protein [Candidatus Brocadia sp.]
MPMGLDLQGQRQANIPPPAPLFPLGSHFKLERAQRRVAPTNGCKSRHGKSRKPCSLDGMG